MIQRTTIIHSDMRAGLLKLSKDQAGDLFMSLLQLADGVEREPDDDSLKILWVIMRAKQFELWDRFDQTSKVRSKAGRKGAKAKYSKCQQTENMSGKYSKCQQTENMSGKSSKCQQMLANAGKCSPIQSNPIQSKPSQESNTPLTPPGGDAVNELSLTGGALNEVDAFERWWGMYPRSPRKSDKKKCADKFARIVDGGVPSEVLLRSLEKRLATDGGWSRDGGDFVEAPSVYLNQKRWEAYADDGDVVGRGEDKKNAGSKSGSFGWDA